MERVRERWRGVLLCFCIAVPCYFLGKVVPIIGGPVFAILGAMGLGTLLRSRGNRLEREQSGIKFTSKVILQAAVVLLGFGMNLGSVLETGKGSLPIIVSTISISLIVVYVLQKFLKVSPKIATLVGVGSSICGGSAIAATAPVIGADDEEIAQAISVIFLFNVIAALVFPAFGSALGLNDAQFGMFAGTAINDTSSVTAAAAAWDGIHGSNTLDTAAIVKMTRTLAIIPITVVLAFVRAKKEESAESVKLSKVFPMFVLYFVIASVITTVCGLPVWLVGGLKDASKFLIVMAMAAIGVNTDLVKLVTTGGKPIFMGICCWGAITGVSLLGI
ncbi:YeiH family protein [Enterocloster lavalensis]|uniref:YeiH family protein n=1 Tax=Enterocloster lavalensis TaxID=460384 RepID=UPI000D1A48D6|nr:YeiH family protein [Enterocloster lavalensis]PST29699.1 putative sulfate exporter family transporter [Enterocloster lavalensis]